MQRTLTKPPLPADCWTWRVELDGTADRCAYRLYRDELALVEGSIEALDGAHRARLLDDRMGEAPRDLAELHGAWQWALGCCRELMVGLDGEVHWEPHPGP